MESGQQMEPPGTPIDLGDFEAWCAANGGSFSAADRGEWACRFPGGDEVRVSEPVSSEDVPGVAVHVEGLDMFINDAVFPAAAIRNDTLVFATSAEAEFDPQGEGAYFEYRPPSTRQSPPGPPP